MRRVSASIAVLSNGRNALKSRSETGQPGSDDSLASGPGLARQACRIHTTVSLFEPFASAVGGGFAGLGRPRGPVRALEQLEAAQGVLKGDWERPSLCQRGCGLGQDRPVARPVGQGRFPRLGRWRLR